MQLGKALGAVCPQDRLVQIITQGTAAATQPPKSDKFMNLDHAVVRSGPCPRREEAGKVYTELEHVGNEGLSEEFWGIDVTMKTLEDIYFHPFSVKSSV